MTTLVYDGSWTGFLTAVFEVYEFKLKDAVIHSSINLQPAMFGKSKTVLSDQVKAKRVWFGLQAKLTSRGLGDIYSSYLSELPDIENQLLAFIQLSIKMKGAEKAYGDPAVLKVAQVAKMVHREKHRMEAFIRFELTTDNIYYAHIEPDFNVIPLLTHHFKNRYADQQWLIYDVKRKYGIFYNLATVEEVYLEFNENAESMFCESEALYQTLWKDYFKHVNIASRKNTALHLRHVPRRYWKHLTEKQI